MKSYEMDMQAMTSTEARWRDALALAVRPQTLAARQTEEFLDVVRSGKTALPEPPDELSSGTIAGLKFPDIAKSLRLAKHKEEQLRCLHDLPRSTHDIDRLFAAGFSVADKHFLTSPVVGSVSWSDLQNQQSYSALKAQCFAFLDNCEHRLAFDGYKAMFRLLECKKPAGQEFKEGDKVVLTKLAIAYSTHVGQDGSLAGFVEWSRRIRFEAGEDIWEQVFCVPKHVAVNTLRDFSRLSELILELEESDDSVKAVLAELYAGRQTYRQAVDKLEELSFRLLHQRYPEKDLAKVMDDFSTLSDSVRVPLPCETLRLLQDQYLNIRTHQEALKKLSNECVLARVKASRSQLRVGEFDMEVAGILIASISEVIRRVYKIQPYNVQILTVLAILAVSGQVRAKSTSRYLTLCTTRVRQAPGN
jgi:hypothetical protein